MGQLQQPHSGRDTLSTKETLEAAALPEVPQPVSARISFETAISEHFRRKLTDPDFKIEAAFLVAAIANLHYSGKLAELDPALQDRVITALNSCSAAAAKKTTVLSDDDRVLLELRQQYSDIGSIPAVKELQVGPYLVEFNPLRALRPRREAERRASALRVPIDPNAFHYGKERLAHEVISDFEAAGVTISHMLNKFPFAKGHTLFVPCRTGKKDGSRYPQFLEGELFPLLQALAERHPERVIVWNSLGAYGSVNAAHFQAADNPRDFPLIAADNERATQGKLEAGYRSTAPYHNQERVVVSHELFIGRQRFSALRDSIEDIHAAHLDGRAVCFYNIICHADRVYNFVRKAQELFRDESIKFGAIPLGTGPAFAECAQRIVITDAEQFELLNSSNQSRAEELLDRMLRSISLKSAHLG